MNQEQKFDKIIRKKVDEAEFPFDENNWNKLSMQLDAERKIASGGWGKFLFLGLLFLGITSASIALYKTDGPFGLKNKIAITNSSSNSVSGENIANDKLPTSSENNLLAVNNDNSNTSEKGFTDNLIDANATLVPTENSKTMNGPSDLNSKNDVNEINSTSKISTKNGSAFKSNKNGIINSNARKGNSLTDSEITNAEAANSSIGGVNEGNSKTNAIGEMNSSERSKSELNGEVNLQHNVLNRIDSKLQIVYSNRNVKLPILKIPSWYDDDYHRKGKKRLSYLNAEIGGAFLLGWDSKEGKDGRGLNWYAGVNYGKFYTKKIGFSVGSQFYNVGNIKQSFFESSKSVYGLGSTSSNTIITTQSLYYFSVPVKFYYAVNPSNQFGVGVNPSFLFSSNNVVENYRLTDDVKSNEITTKSSGIYEGVRLNNILISAFYKTKLSKRMFLNTEVLYGVRDIFKNTPSNNYTQKPLGIRLGIQYTLFEK